MRLDQDTRTAAVRDRIFQLMLHRHQNIWQGNLAELLQELEKQSYKTWLPSNPRSLRVFLGKAVDELVAWGLRFDTWRDNKGRQVRIYWNKGD